MRDATVWIGKRNGLFAKQQYSLGWKLCKFSRLRWRICLWFYYLLKLVTLPFSLICLPHVLPHYINPDLFQDKKIQRDLMSTWPLAAKPLESRWFGAEELPEAHLSFDVFSLVKMTFNNMISWHRVVFGDLNKKSTSEKLWFRVVLEVLWSFEIQWFVLKSFGPGKHVSFTILYSTLEVELFLDLSFQNAPV